MILNLIRKYSEIISGYKIVNFKMVGNSYSLVCEISFTDKTRLFVRDYVFSDGTKKYSFHWQDIQGNCILRWDNAPHHQKVTTFPFHKHIGKSESVSESKPMKLDEALNHIYEQIQSYGQQQQGLKSPPSFPCRETAM
jgi:hypothetical protein